MTAASGRLCLLTCCNFQREFTAAIALEGWTNVVCVAYSARCGRPPLSWTELRALLPEDCARVVILGRACLAGLENPPAGWPEVRMLVQEQCFHLVAEPALVDGAIARGAYLTTPAWLPAWREHLFAMGFAPEQLGEFFREFAAELVLLDTGIDPTAPERLAEMGSFLSLPVRRIDVGLDRTRVLLRRIVEDWRSEAA